MTNRYLISTGRYGGVGGPPLRAVDFHSTSRISGAPSLRSLQGPALSVVEGAGVNTVWNNISGLWRQHEHVIKCR